jgi:hypothetical protein
MRCSVEHLSVRTIAAAAVVTAAPVCISKHICTVLLILHAACSFSLPPVHTAECCTIEAARLLSQLSQQRTLTAHSTLQPTAVQ